ncbi:hypothetical protein [Corynebacterium urealyticum]|uniref:hypothetical protein n=1 Tax=Corynebacterium urealyticum TaxID=43771 RepID=UPI0002B3FA79|nr:hypothetical protein [Corynebacterium urealyticum]AGE35971.1 hypothetical protein CU7111_0376 [Corynebacterium urealyticum DSM 7111]QQB07668.1 hypothetical protein I6H53_00450 [Corynebacterium urealyticum]
MRQQQRVERAIKQLASYGVPVGPAESAAGFTRGLDPDALQSAAHLLFRTPPPVLRADPKDLEGCGGVQLAQACAAQQQYDQGLVHVAESGRGAADLIGNLCEHTAAEVERIVSRFEDQVEQSRIALPECPPELLKAMGDSAQRAVCEQLERRNKALGEAADQLVADCEAAVANGEGEVQLSTTDPAVLEAVNGQDVGGGHGEQLEQGGEVSSEGQDATPALGTDSPEHDGRGGEAALVAEPQPQEAPGPEGDVAGSGQDGAANDDAGGTTTYGGDVQSGDDGAVVELETSGALPQDVEPAEAAAWSPDIWLAEGADTAQAEQASHASGDGAIGGLNAEPGGSPAVKPATTGITVERTYEVGIERSGQW